MACAVRTKAAEREENPFTPDEALASYAEVNEMYREIFNKTKSHLRKSGYTPA